MKNPFKKSSNIMKKPPPSDSEIPKTLLSPNTDPIYVTHSEDPSLGEDEMIIHTTVEPSSINHKENDS